MANVLYDKTERLPPATDSLKRALLLSVWLRRQEMKVNETSVLVEAVADLVEQKGNGRSVKAFNKFLESAYPFVVRNRQVTDAKLMEQMKKEVDKGPISFTPIDSKSIFLNAAKKRVDLSDDFRAKLKGRRALH